MTITCRRNILTIVAVAILTLAIGQVQAMTVTVPNSDFELIYKPGQTTITGVVSGGGWTQGVGPDCPIDAGVYEFADLTTGDTADIPGWLRVRQAGVDRLGRHIRTGPNYWKPSGFPSKRKQPYPGWSKLLFVQR